MKISVSLPAEDVAFLDEYARSLATPTRSGALHRAIQAVRNLQLGPDYEAAWHEFRDEGAKWDTTVGDGLSKR